MKPLKTNVEEVLRGAIASEMKTRALYLKMAEGAPEGPVQMRLIRLADAQLLHRARLERRYRELLRTNAPDPEAFTIADIPPEAPDLDLKRVLKIALEHERESESNYRFLAERVPDDRELESLFHELAELEWSHKIELQKEYDQLEPEGFLSDI
ncbi:MAG: ferritin family protein [Acidobacteriota bacterium]